MAVTVNARRVLPATFDQFVEQWDHFITVSILRISGRNLRLQDLDDHKQQVYLRLLETGYLDRYNPSKGNISTYLYPVVRSVLCNQFERNTRNPLNMANSLEPRPEAILMGTYKELRDEGWERREHARQVLARFEAYVGQVRDGAQLVAILRLLHEGYNRTEIAAKIGVPVAAVVSQGRRIRTLLRARVS